MQPSSQRQVFDSVFNHVFDRYRVWATLPCASLVTMCSRVTSSTCKATLRRLCVSDTYATSAASRPNWRSTASLLNGRNCFKPLATMGVRRTGRSYVRRCLFSPPAVCAHVSDVACVQPPLMTSAWNSMSGTPATRILSSSQVVGLPASQTALMKTVPYAALAPRVTPTTTLQQALARAKQYATLRPNTLWRRESPSTSP